MNRRRSSAQITLVLIGTALAGCSQQPVPMARDHYASIEDCAADWGRPERCDRAQSSGFPGFLFLGPLYAANARSNALSEARRSGIAGFADSVRQGKAIGSSMAPTARGGFGASSRSFSAGG